MQQLALISVHLRLTAKKRFDSEVRSRTRWKCDVCGYTTKWKKVMSDLEVGEVSQHKCSNRTQAGVSMKLNVTLIIKKKAGRLLDGQLHDGMPA